MIGDEFCDFRHVLVFVLFFCFFAHETFILIEILLVIPKERLGRELHDQLINMLLGRPNRWDDHYMTLPQGVPYKTYTKEDSKFKMLLEN